MAYHSSLGSTLRAYIVVLAHLMSHFLLEGYMYIQIKWLSIVAAVYVICPSTLNDSFSPGDVAVILIHCNCICNFQTQFRGRNPGYFQWNCHQGAFNCTLCEMYNLTDCRLNCVSKKTTNKNDTDYVSLEHQICNVKCFVVIKHMSISIKMLLSHMYLSIAF